MTDDGAALGLLQAADVVSALKKCGEKQSKRVENTSLEGEKWPVNLMLSYCDKYSVMIEYFVSK